jgi:hypothetical protein
MKKAILLSTLSLVLFGFLGCSHTAKGVEKDTHSDVKWVGHHV